VTRRLDNKETQLDCIDSKDSRPGTYNLDNKGIQLGTRRLDNKEIWLGTHTVDY